MPAVRALVAAAALLTLAACAERADLNEPVVPIGDFRLGHNVVVAKDTTEGPFSRDATEQELEAALSSEIEQRLRRYDGDGLYHIGVRIEAFVLGQPGIPILLSPQSVLILAVNIWDNETRQRLNAEPIRVTAFEALNTRVPILSSGSRELQGRAAREPLDQRRPPDRAAPARERGHLVRPETRPRARRIHPRHAAHPRTAGDRADRHRRGQRVPRRSHAPRSLHDLAPASPRRCSRRPRRRACRQLNCRLIFPHRADRRRAVLKRAAPAPIR